MNTILTNDEIDRQIQGNTGDASPWSKPLAFHQFARAIEAAVLAKLREQEPLSDDARELIGAMVSELRQHRWCGDCYPENGWPEVNKVLADYAKFKRQRAAAPLPAVVQAPPIPLNIIRKWPDGFEARLQHVWKDVISFIPNVKLRDLQRVLAEFGFRMEVYDQTSAPEAPATAVAQVPQECPTCKGNGDYEKALSSTNYTWVKCADCGGTGKLAAPEAPAQGDPLEKLTRIQEELGLYDDKPAQPSVPAPWREAVKVMRWRPIKTAPRDGTNILLRWGSDGVSQGHYIPGIPRPWKFIDTNNGITWLINHSIDGPGGPSHWMPMPPAAIALADSLEGGE